MALILKNLVHVLHHRDVLIEDAITQIVSQEADTIESCMKQDE